MNSLIADPDYALFCQERLQDPHAFYRRLRSEDPVHWCEPIKLWLVTRYDDVIRSLRDPRLSSNRTGMYVQALEPGLRTRVQPLIDHIGKWVQQTDEPDHGRLRKLVTSAFTQQMVEAARPRIEAAIDAMLGALPADGPVDLMEAFCIPLPATVICELLGVPVGQRDRFRAATARLAAFSGRGGPALAGFAEDAHAALGELAAMFEPLIEERRAAGKGDLLSALVSANADGDRLSDDELLAMCVFLFLAGHDTTASGIANGILALLRNPAQFAALKAGVDDLVGGAVEETLRYESPVPRAVRLARESLEIGGRTIAAGQLVVFLLGAANRDPAQYPDPDVFDIRRNPKRILAFGHGLHFCIGALLARIEMELAFRAVVRRLPGLRLAGEPVVWKTAMGLRAPEKLEVFLSERR